MSKKNTTDWNDRKNIDEIIYSPLNLAIDNSDHSLVGQALSAVQNAIFFSEMHPPSSGTFTAKNNSFIFDNCKLDDFGGIEAMITGYAKITSSPPIIRENLNIALATTEFNLTIHYLKGNDFIEGDKKTWVGKITTTTVKPHTHQSLITAQQASQFRIVVKTDKLVTYAATRDNFFSTVKYTLTDFESINYTTLDHNNNKINWLSTVGKLQVENSVIGNYEIGFSNLSQPFIMDVHFPTSGKLEIINQDNSQSSILISPQDNGKNFDYQSIVQGDQNMKLTQNWENFVGWEAETLSFI